MGGWKEDFKQNGSLIEGSAAKSLGRWPWLMARRDLHFPTPCAVPCRAGRGLCTARRARGMLGPPHRCLTALITGLPVPPRRRSGAAAGAEPGGGRRARDAPLRSGRSCSAEGPPFVHQLRLPAPLPPCLPFPEPSSSSSCCCRRSSRRAPPPERGRALPSVSAPRAPRTAGLAAFLTTPIPTRRIKAALRVD